MALLSKTSDSSSIFEDGKLKPGIYRIQNLYARTYLDVQKHSKEVCCRPVEKLEKRDGLVRPSIRLAFAYLTIRSGKSSVLGPDIL